LQNRLLRRGNKLLHRYKGQQGGQTKINQHQKHQQQTLGQKYQQQFITLPITKYVEILFVFVRTHLCLRRQPSTNIYNYEHIYISLRGHKLLPITCEILLQSVVHLLRSHRNYAEGRGPIRGNMWPKGHLIREYTALKGVPMTC